MSTNLKSWHTMRWKNYYYHSRVQVMLHMNITPLSLLKIQAPPTIYRIPSNAARPLLPSVYGPQLFLVRYQPVHAAVCEER